MPHSAMAKWMLVVLVNWAGVACMDFQGAQAETWLLSPEGSKRGPLRVSRYIDIFIPDVAAATFFNYCVLFSS